MNGITTHILDTSCGLPAPRVPVTLEGGENERWTLLAHSQTDADGRARLLDYTPAEGTYRLTFEVASYFAARNAPAFYPVVQITFTVQDARHHHVPLLLSPFGYSTYRGS